MAGMVAISDLHLGAPASYLAVRSVRSRLFDTIRGLSDGYLDLLVLVGDVIDLTVGRAPEPWVIAREFFKELADSVPMGGLVYVPGNHDHHVWVMLAEYQELLRKIGELKRPPMGAVGHGGPQPVAGTAYPYWTPLHNLFETSFQRKVVFAYPFHMELHGDTRFVFHHGHFFDPKISPLASYAGARYKDWTRVEAFNLPYIESLFSLCAWDSLVQDMELVFYSKLTRYGLTRPARCGRRVLEWVRKRRHRESLGGCAIDRIDKMMEWGGFKSMQLRENDVWVFGHTHCKGAYAPSEAPKAMRWFNLGGWILNYDPALGGNGAWSTPGIFYADQDGNCDCQGITLERREEESIRAKILRPGRTVR